MQTIVSLGLLLAFFAMAPMSADPQGQPSAAIGWYNGDWQTGMPGQPNWYVSNIHCSRVYDDFVVPEGGWTVVGVFSDDNLREFPPVRKASWEIRSGMLPDKGGKVVASGKSRATQTRVASRQANPDGSLYRIEVDGLQVKLAPGKYWLSVSPIGEGQSFLAATRGVNAVGEPRGNNGGALVYAVHGVLVWMRDPSRAAALNSHFEPVEAVGQYGNVGLAKDFSQGVLIAPRLP